MYFSIANNLLDPDNGNGHFTGLPIASCDPPFSNFEIFFFFLTLRTLVPLELELQMVLSYLVGARNQAQIFGKATSALIHLATTQPQFWYFLSDNYIQMAKGSARWKEATALL